MPTTKPTGPYRVWVKSESTTPFTFAQWAATDAIKTLESTMGDTIRARKEIKEARGDRGRYAFYIDKFENIPWSIKARLCGSGTAGTAKASWKALLESAAGLTELDEAATVTYTSSTASPASAVSIYRVDRQGLLGEYLIGAICQQIQIQADKSNPPTITFSGVAGRKWEFLKTTLAAEIAAVDTLTMTLTDPKNIRTGEDNATSVSGLSIYVKIESEIVKITAMNYATGVATIVRAQFGTSAATHANALAVYPYNETPTYPEAGTPIGPHGWTVNDGAAVKWRSFDLTLETGRAFDELQSGEESPSGVHCTDIKGAGSFTYLYSTTRGYYGRDMDAGTEKDVAITLYPDAGSTAGSNFVINLDHMRLTGGSPKDLPDDGKPLEISQPFELVDTTTALAQFQIVES